MTERAVPSASPCPVPDLVIGSFATLDRHRDKPQGLIAAPRRSAGSPQKRCKHRVERTSDGLHVNALNVEVFDALWVRDSIPNLPRTGKGGKVHQVLQVAVLHVV